MEDSNLSSSTSSLINYNNNCDIWNLDFLPDSQRSVVNKAAQVRNMKKLPTEKTFLNPYGLEMCKSRDFLNFCGPRDFMEIKVSEFFLSQDFSLLKIPGVFIAGISQS